MTSDSIDNTTPAPEAEQLKSRRKFTKKPKVTKKQAAAKKAG